MRAARTVLFRGLEGMAVAVFAVLLVNVLWGVFTRYVLSEQARWSEEVARLLLVWLAFLGAVLALFHHEHLGMDLLAQKLHPDARRIAQIAVHSVVLGFAAFILGWGGFQLVWQRWEARQLLPALGISKAWFYLAIPVSGVVVAFFSLGEITSAARKREP